MTGVGSETELRREEGETKEKEGRKEASASAGGVGVRVLSPFPSGLPAFPSRSISSVSGPVCCLILRETSRIRDEHLPDQKSISVLQASGDLNQIRSTNKDTLMAEWSHLPFDVLQHFAGFLPLPDYHRFGAVCRNWAIAAKQIRHCSPVKQVPWLLVRGETDPHERRVFSISENRHYNIAFPELQGRYVGGSSYGWLFTMDIDLNFRLLNPLTGKHYDLPPPPPFFGMANVHVRYVREAPGADEMTYEDAQIVSVYKAITDHDPSQRSDFMVLILYGMYQRRLAFWRPGNLVWTLVEGTYFSFDDIAFFKGNFYANDNIFIAEAEVSVTYLVDVGPVPKLT